MSTPLLKNIFIVILANAVTVECQFNAAWQWQPPTACNTSSIFDTISMTCVPCSQGLVPGVRRDECVCAPGTHATGWTGGRLECQPCGSGQGVSADGWSCIDCRGPSNDSSSVDSQSGYCTACGPDEVVIHPSVNTQQCEACPPGSYPTEHGSQCAPCNDASCFCLTVSFDLVTPPFVNQKFQNPDLCIPSQDAVSIPLENGDHFSSAYITSYLAHAEAQCRSGNARECQHLANMCVLQNYARGNPTTPCSLLEAIQRSSSSLPVPVISYYNTEASIEFSRENAIDATFNVDPDLPNSQLDIVSFMYALNGTFAGTAATTGGLLQICPTSRQSLDGTFLFGREYKQTCELILADIIDQAVMKRSRDIGNEETVFHELYLRYTDNANRVMMYPIPIVNENIQQQNSYVNRAREISRYVLTRRFFVFDDSQEHQTSVERRLYRVPAGIYLHIEFQLSRDGRIYPPFLRIRHNEFVFSNAVNETADDHVPYQSLTTGFEVRYRINTIRHDKTIEVLMATFCSVSVLWGALKAYAWGRRAGKQIIDIATVIKFLFFMADVISNVFLLVIGSMAVWITFAYKLQKHVIYVLLAPDQELSFIIYVTVALGLKAIALVHRYADLILTETFFIDWERSKQILDSEAEQGGKDTVAKPPSLRVTEADDRGVVIWRTYLIANEWNELQNYRKTSVACQAVFMLVILEFLDFKDFALIQPGFARGDQPPEYAESRLSRFAVDVTAYLVTGLVQWIVHVLVIEKLVDPFHNFMDLCSVANVSVLAMTHPQRGFYIHGRSVHGMADTNMHDMNKFLQSERNNLCGLRGLESNSELQTFVINMPRTFRDSYDEITQSLRVVSTNVRLNGADKLTNRVETIARVYQQLNQYLKEVIDHTVPSADYVVTDSRFIEEVLGLELTDTTKQGTFTRDPSEMAYSSVFVYGNEWPNMAFEMLLFCVIDLFLKNRIFAAAVTFGVSALVQKVASLFFTNNLVKSSLVDGRFLI